MPKDKTLPSIKELNKELNKVQKWTDGKIKKQEEKQRKVFEEEELVRKNTKKLILITAVNGNELGDLTINILDSVDKLIVFIICKLKVYNITNIVINNISKEVNEEYYKDSGQRRSLKLEKFQEYYRGSHFSQWGSLKQEFNLSEDTDNILVQIICGSYINYINFIISDYATLYGNTGAGDDSDDYDDSDEKKQLVMIRTNNIPQNYLSSNLEEFHKFNELITNYRYYYSYIWAINYLQSYFE